MKNWILIVILSGLSLGCATQRVYVQGDLTGPPSFEETQGFWFGGIGQEAQINATEICNAKRSQLSRVEVKQTLKDVVLTGVTFGIYAPRTVRISCRR